MKSILDIYSDIAKKNPVWTIEQERESIERLWKKDHAKWVTEAMNHNLGLVFATMMKVGFTANKRNEDVFQRAVAAMVDALRKYEPDRGVKVSTWVSAPIRWAVLQSQGINSKYATIADNIASINYRDGTHISLKSIDDPVGRAKDGSDATTTLADVVSADDVAPGYMSERPLNEVEESTKKADLKVAMKVLRARMPVLLNSQETRVVNGLMAGKKMVEIGVEMGVCRMRISQISANAFRKIRSSDVGPLLHDLLK